MSVTNPLQSLSGRIPSGSFGTEQQTVAAPMLNSGSGRFAIKLPAFSDVGNAHIAVGRWVLGERQFMSGNGQVADPVPQLVLAAVLISQ
jgi:hypothetical protein